MFRKKIKMIFYMKNGVIIKDSITVRGRLSKEQFNDVLEQFIDSAKTVLKCCEPSGCVGFGKVYVRAADVSAIIFS